MKRPYALFEVTFVCWDENDQESFSKWLANYTDGMDILYAGFRDADSHDYETMVDSGYLPDDEGGD